MEVDRQSSSGEGGHHVNGFRRLFVWNEKSRKRLLTTGLSEQLKLKTNSNTTMPVTRYHHPKTQRQHSRQKGVTVFLCGLAIAVLGPLVNAPTVMLANFVATPLELSLMVVFLRFGEFVTGGPHFPLTSDALKKVLTGEASTEIFGSILRALLGWLLLAPLIVGALYVVLLPCFIILVHKFSNASSPKPASPSSTELRLKVREN